MKSFNVVTGMPRAGSTLMCNVLNQNPEIYASSTSPLPAMLGTLVNTISSSDEMRSMLIHNRDDAETRVSDAVKEMIRGWYADKEGHVFDKGRGWTNHMRSLRDISPESVAVIMVRDPRDVIASIHKQDSKFPLFDQASSPMEKHIHTRSELLMNADGMVGSSILGVEDVLRRGIEAIFVRYEDFVVKPREIITNIYKTLGVDGYQIDIDNVENVATDADGLYLNKYPHEGSGKITADSIGNWRNTLDTELADQIRGVYPFFTKEFGY